MFQMKSRVMRKPVDKSKHCWLTRPCVSKGTALFCRECASDAYLDGKARRKSDQSPREGSPFLNGELRMRNRLQVSFWGLRLDADGIIAIAAALLIVLVFALLSALQF
jgi:hypothetical protein